MNLNHDIEFSLLNPAVHTAEFKPIMEQQVIIKVRSYEITEEGDDIHLVLRPEPQAGNISTRYILSKQLLHALKDVIAAV